MMKMFFWIASELILFLLFVPLALAILAIIAIESRLPNRDGYA